MAVLVETERVIMTCFKPEISIDAAVVGYGGTEHGVSESLLALITPSGRYQTIGRVSRLREIITCCTLRAERAEARDR